MSKGEETAHRSAVATEQLGYLINSDQMKQAENAQSQWSFLEIPSFQTTSVIFTIARASFSR